MIFISFGSIVLSVLFSLWGLFLHWLSIFAAPLQEPEMFWIIIPIWINWFFTEFFMEKHGTSFGNAIGNGVMPILASVDWARYLYRLISEGIIRLTFGVLIKFFLSLAVLIYGVFVIIAGIKIERIVFYIGRIRWITYVLVMTTPIVYNVIKFDFQTCLAILLFFPLYWWVIEIFDRITPEPRVYQESS
ncbi:hypothetical protein J4234_06480 [Candidatus Woesearchaeota archaeon]|nr:hypothetical protein [Candidatus Woesearchaeota archaeon]